MVDFIWEYEERWVEGDLDWMVAHMHPGTFDFWTPDECRETLAFKQPFQTPLQELRETTYFAAFYFDYGEGRRGDYTDLHRVATTQLGPEGDEDGVFTVSFFKASRSGSATAIFPQRCSASANNLCTALVAVRRNRQVLAGRHSGEAGTSRNE